VTALCSERFAEIVRSQSLSRRIYNTSDRRYRQLTCVRVCVHVRVRVVRVRVRVRVRMHVCVRMRVYVRVRVYVCVCVCVCMPITGTDSERRLCKRRWTNTNELLQEGYYGIKTGVTPATGYCLASEFKFNLSSPPPHTTPSHSTPCPADGVSANAARRNAARNGDGDSTQGNLSGIVCIVLGNKTKFDRCVCVRVHARGREHLQVREEGREREAL